jgi:hypothetical protein
MAKARTESRQHWLFVIPLALSVAALTILTLQTAALTISELDREWHYLSWPWGWLTSNTPWSGQGDASVWPAFALTVLLSATFIIYWYPRRGRGLDLAATTALTLAFVAIVLGAATYIPCTPSWRMFAAPIGWILEMFVGGVESSPSAGEACVAAQAPGFVVARTAALLATFIGAISAAAVLGRSQLDRLMVRLSSDVDVVVGLDVMTLALVKALVVENSQGNRRANWINPQPRWLVREPEEDPPAPPLLRDDPRPSTRPMPTPKPATGDHFFQIRYSLTGLRRGDVRRALARRTRVVVLEPDRHHPLIAEARAAGAVVITADPTRESTMRSVISRMQVTRGGPAPGEPPANVPGHGQ